MALITRGDLLTAYLRWKQKRKGSVLARVFGGRKERIVRTWSGVETIVRHWWQIPQVTARTNRLITGSASETPFAFVAKTFLGGGGLRGLSIGCGAGSREAAWMETGAFATIDAIDVSAGRILEARSRTTVTQWKDRIHFHEADWMTYDAVPESVDVVIAEGILHHLTPLAEAVEKIARVLRTGGLLIMNEYVGPRRFQWTDVQRTISADLLGSIPEPLRTYRGTNLVKRAIYPPGEMSMRLYDPSEAVESDRVLAAVSAMLSGRLLRPYGGTILHPVLKDIAHHFVPGSGESDRVLRDLFRREEEALATGNISSDFIFGVFQRES